MGTGSGRAFIGVLTTGGDALPSNYVVSVTGLLSCSPYNFFLQKRETVVEHESSVGFQSFFLA